MPERPPQDLPPLTHLEARVLAAIERHVRSEGVAPTIAELAGDLRLRSRGTVHRYVQSLIAKGRLERQGNGWRALRIVGLDVPERRSNVHHLDFGRRSGDAGAGDASAPPDAPGERRRAGPGRTGPVVPLARRDGADAAGASRDAPGGPGDPSRERGDDPSRLPLLGRIAAGLPIEAIEDQDHLDLVGLFAGPDRFALRVSGDSMIDAGILDGDTVIVRKRDDANVGDIVVALIDGHEATLKRLGARTGDTVELIPANAAMQPMRYAASRVRVQGVLVGQLRRY